MREQRRLAAILATDMVGFSLQMGADEEGTLALITNLRIEIFEPCITQFQGRIFKTTGDGLLAEFASVVKAVECAVRLQEMLQDRYSSAPDNQKFQFRMGINLGDIITQQDDVFGEGVNIAARLENFAEPGGICISNTVYHSVNGKIDIGFKDLGTQNFKNIDRPVRVYRLVSADNIARSNFYEPLTWKKTTIAALCILVVVTGGYFIWQVWLSGSKSTVQENRLTLVAQKPSLIVLPFTNLSDDKSQEYFSDGLTSDLTTDLSRISGLTVIARSSAFSFKDQSPDIRTIGKELGVRYAVEGNVQKLGERVRINVQLINSESGGHIWAERFDRSVDNLFDIQDEVREKIVESLKITLSSREKRWLTQRPTSSPEAYNIYLKGLQQESFFTRENNIEARHLFHRAIEHDPKFAAAYAHLAQAYSLAAENGWIDNPTEFTARALELAKKAIELDDELPIAHWSLGRLLIRPQFADFEESIASLNRAIELNPNYSDGYAYLAIVYVYRGQAEQALGVIEKAMRLNPKFPFWYFFTLGQAQFFLTRYDIAVQNFKKAIERNPTVPWPHRWLISAYGHLGNLEDAEWEIAELESLNQIVTVQTFREYTALHDQGYLKHYLDGLRKAGIPES